MKRIQDNKKEPEVMTRGGFKPLSETDEKFVEMENICEWCNEPVTDCPCEYAVQEERK